jgi:phosphatidylglycerophosphate synthase
MSLLYRFKPLKDAILRPVLSTLQACGVTPNIVTLLGVVLSIAAALCAASGQLHLGIVLFIFAACLDALDGSLARSSGKCTEFGRYFDSVSDRISEVGFIIGAVVGGGTLWALLVAAGSVVLLLTRTVLHLKGAHTNLVWISRPERLVLIVAGFLSPPPYNIVLFLIGGSLCLIASAHVVLMTIFRGGSNDEAPGSNTDINE